VLFLQLTWSILHALAHTLTYTLLGNRNQFKNRLLNSWLGWINLFDFALRNNRFHSAPQSNRFLFRAAIVYNVQATPNILVKNMHHFFFLDQGYETLRSTSNSFRWGHEATTVSFLFKLSWNILIQACRGKIYFFQDAWSAILFTRRHDHIRMATLWHNWNLPQSRFLRKQKRNWKIFHISRFNRIFLMTKHLFQSHSGSPTSVSAQQTKVLISKYIWTRNWSTLSILCKKVVDVWVNDLLLDTWNWKY
jgi:hypothetical protein